MAAHTQKTGFIGFCWAAHILKISAPVYFTQIAKRIVTLIPVDMVNMRRRFSARDVQPCQPMSKSFFIVDCDSPVTGFRSATSFFTNQIRTINALRPSKIASYRVVTQNSADIVSGYHDTDFTIAVAK